MPFRPCKSKINNLFIGNAEDLDIAVLMCNLLEYNDSYCIASGNVEDIIEMNLMLIKIMLVIMQG